MKNFGGIFVQITLFKCSLIAQIHWKFNFSENETRAAPARVLPNWEILKFHFKQQGSAQLQCI